MSPRGYYRFTSRQTGILLFTGWSVDIFFIGGPVWVLVFISIELFFGVVFGLLEYLIATLIIGLLLQLAIFGLMRKRFRNPVKDADLLALFEEVKVDLNKDLGIELWFRDVDRYVFTSSANPLFKAILFSESAISDILSVREKGKIVLAREALELEQFSPLRGLAFGLLNFTYFSLSCNPFRFFIYGSFTIEYMAPILTLAIAGFILMLVLGKPIIWRSDHHVDEIVEGIYGTTRKQ